GLRSTTTPVAPVITPIAARKNRTELILAPRSSLALVPQRRTLERLGQQHLLGEDQVRAVVVGELVVVAHGDGVERAGDLAVATEDAAGEVDLVHGRVALARGDAVLGSVLGGDHADAVGRAGGRAQRAADALLEATVLEAVQLVTPAEAGVDGGLLLRVLDCDGSLREAPKGRQQAPGRLAERAPRGSPPPRVWRGHDLDYVIARVPALDLQRCRVRGGLLGLGRCIAHQWTATTTMAVTRVLTVARGRSTFQPKLISWS